MHAKRISAGHVKGTKWASAVRGPHERKESITLIELVKGVGLADKAVEANKIISSGKVLVDGKPMKEPRHGVGLMDVVSIPELKKHYRILPEKNGLVYREIKEADAKLKLCRVTGKTVLAAGKVQVNLHDGSNILTDKKLAVNDTLVLTLPDRKLKDVISYGAGTHALVVRGRHRGEQGKVKEVVAGDASRRSLTTVGDFQTLTDYVFTLGADKAVVNV